MKCVTSECLGGPLITKAAGGENYEQVGKWYTMKKLPLLSFLSHRNSQLGHRLCTLICPWSVCQVKKLIILTNPNAYLIIFVQGYISFRLDKLIHTE